MAIVLQLADKVMQDLESHEIEALLNGQAQVECLMLGDGKTPPTPQPKAEPQPVRPQPTNAGQTQSNWGEKPKRKPASDDPIEQFAAEFEQVEDRYKAMEMLHSDERVNLKKELISLAKVLGVRLRSKDTKQQICDKLVRNIIDSQNRTRIFSTLELKSR
jgi:hypothetical protein